MKRSDNGFTLVEILVVTVILGIISGGVYYTLNEARAKEALVSARGIAQAEAGKFLSIAQRDLAMARFNSLKINGQDFEFEVNTPKGAKKVQYRYSKPEMRRRFDGQTWLMAEHLEQISLTRQATGQYLLELQTLVVPSGMREDQAQTHTQNQLIVLREDMTSMNDPNWRDVGDVSGVFSSHGDLMGGVKKDMEKVVEDFTSELDQIRKDVESATVGQAKEKLAEIKNVLNKNLGNIQSNLKGLDDQITGMAEEGILKITHKLFERTERRKECARKMRDALGNMKTAGSMNWNQIKGIAGGYGYGGDIRDSFQSMFKAKQDLFKAGKEIIGTMNDLKVEVSGVDPSVFR